MQKKQVLSMMMATFRAAINVFTTDGFNVSKIKNMKAIHNFHEGIVFNVRHFWIALPIELI